MITSGIIKFNIDGESHYIGGDIDYTTGTPKREELVTADGRVMYKETPTAATVEGKVQDRSNFSWTQFQKIDGVNVTLDLGTGKILSFPDCFYAGEGKGSTGSGELSFKLVSRGQCEEITN